MKTSPMRSLAGLAAFAVLSSIPAAANAVVLDLWGSVESGVFMRSNIGAGQFTDTVSFTITEAGDFASSLTSPTSNIGAEGDIDFESVVLTGAQGPFSFSIVNNGGPTGKVDSAAFGRYLTAGDYTLTIKAKSFGGAGYSGVTQLTPPTSAAPEPSSWALMILGFGGAGAALRSRRRVAVA